MATRTATIRAVVETEAAAPTLLTIKPPRIAVLPLRIQGDAPLVLCKFSAKSRETMRANQAAGTTARTKKVREAKDFDAMYQNARHVSTEGWDGIPAAAFRAACVSACRLVGFKMTMAKLSVFVLPDGFDADEGVGLVKITKGLPRKFEAVGRNATGVTDIRVRPQWLPGWEAVPQIRFDQDQFTAADIVNLMARVGIQVGVGEGRPDSRNSPGQGWGTFAVLTGAND